MVTDSSVLLPTAYFPPLSYIFQLINGQKIFIEQMETYPKQTYRNRCEIMTSSGKLNLIVPISKPDGNHTLTKDIAISYREPWNRHHWKSIQTAYRSSPYFNYYSDILEPLFNTNETSLINLNLNILKVINQILGINPACEFTTDYINQPEACTDLRAKMKPKRQYSGDSYPVYPQVFSHIHGFMPNLSILDLIFNAGPEARNYLEMI